MADFLTAHLQAKGGEHSSLAMLVNQWGFDAQLIPKALQTVGSMFPHYSRHDESHSKQILVNIERLLGDNIQLLTATDTWLILEAAYWHDIGMVVPEQDVIDACQKEDFKSYLDEIRLAPNHELHKFAKSFDATSASACFAGADTPFDAVDKFRQLMADWFRRLHPGRAEAIVQSPWISASISSPRTELIPNRLFRILGRICHMHGLPFSEVISDTGLPFREAGLAREDRHPRFVACLLRMGDLLDLDDNRFCPVMQRIAGENRPNSSKAHEDKHTGLRHLRLDNERIEISAECLTIEGYLETFRWFTWIRQELQDQMARWQDIVPHRSLGLLPTLGRLSVRLSGKLQILDEGVRPQFSLDNERAIALLQGENLYASKYACIRELLQNAVDATLMHLWLLRGSKAAESWNSPLAKEIAADLKSLPVTVSITELPAQKGVVNKSRWEIVISDKGTGISKDDLGYMLRIGGSQRNPTRQSLMRTMPEWMKPSGSFGIGFQSAFMISPSVTVITKSVYTNQILEVTMFSPTGPKDGLVLIEVMPNDVARHPGTIVKLSVELEAYTSYLHRSLADKAPIVTAFLRSADPVLDDKFPLEAAQLADQVGIFSEKSLIPICGKMTTDGSSFPVGSAPSEQEPRQEPRYLSEGWSFLSVGDDAFSVQVVPTLTSFRRISLQTFYRGQPFEFNGYIPYARVEIDIMSRRAGAWLSASRDKVASNARSLLYDLVLRAVELKVARDFDEDLPAIKAQPDLRPVYSLFLETMALSHGGKWIEHARRLDNAWLDLFVKESMTFRAFFSGQGGVVVANPKTGGEDPTETDYIVDSSFGDILLRLILKTWLHDPGRTVGVIAPESVKEKSDVAPLMGEGRNLILEHRRSERQFRTRYSLKKIAQPPYTPEALATRLAALVRLRGANQRFLFIGDERWRTLWLREAIPLRALPLFVVADPAAKFVILPFLFVGHAEKVEATPDQLDKLSFWSLSRIQDSSPISEIRRLYEELVSYIDNEIMYKSIHRDLWRRSRGTSE